MAEADYRTAVPDIAAIAELEKAIAGFDTAIAEARARDTIAKNAVSNAQRQSLEPYRLSCVQAQAAADDAMKQNAAAQQRHRSLVDLQASLTDQLENLRVLEQSSGALRGIAESFDGQNEMRTSLETFAIGAMFDQVLEAANLRLDPMTTGRYRFERDTESIGGRSKRGLDVRVHDIETGRAREIITLSGGETFIAALSLALGLWRAAVPPDRPAAGALEKAWRDAQGAAVAASKADREAQSNASSAKATFDARRTVLAGLAEPKRSVSKTEADLQQVVAQIDALGAAVDIGVLTQDLDAARKRKLAAAEALQQARDALGTAMTAEALARQAYEERITSVPESLRQHDVLQAAIDAATADLGGRKQALADADAKQRELNTIAIKAAAELQSAAITASESEKDLAAKQAAFEARLIELGMSIAWVGKLRFA